MSSATYAYAAASAVRADAGRASLDLATSGGTTPLGSVARPYFFAGFAEHPAVVAAALLAVARVARTRFYVPPNTLAAILRAADPVVTATPEGLRFESFSVCCGVAARLDVLPDGLDPSHQATGVTNVDVNPPLRQALASIRPSEPLHLRVGDDHLAVETFDGEVVEEQVALPSRWLRGFGESQYLASGMALRHRLDAAAARRFVQSLPRSTATRTVMWATRGVQALRLATTPSPGAVCVAGPERLRVLEPLLRWATGLSAYGPDADRGSPPQGSVWVLDLPGARLSIGLSPEKSRGFSGEGAMLPGLIGDDVVEDADALIAALAFEPRLDLARLAGLTDLTTARAEAALGVLASSGQVGFDNAADAYFHRPLPLSGEGLEIVHPRLAGMRRLLESGAVTPVGEGRFEVLSGGVRYDVRLAARPDDDRCTCPWWAKYRGSRGPCKHVLAARSTAAEPEAR